MFCLKLSLRHACWHHLRLNKAWPCDNTITVVQGPLCSRTPKQSARDNAVSRTGRQSVYSCKFCLPSL